MTHRLPREHLARIKLEPGGIGCCRPDDVPFASWAFNHAPPGQWPALGHVAVAVSVVMFAAVVTGNKRKRLDATNA